MINTLIPLASILEKEGKTSTSLKVILVFWTIVYWQRCDKRKSPYHWGNTIFNTTADNMNNVKINQSISQSIMTRYTVVVDFPYLCGYFN